MKLAQIFLEKIHLARVKPLEELRKPLPRDRIIHLRMEHMLFFEHVDHSFESFRESFELGLFLISCKKGYWLDNLTEYQLPAAETTRIRASFPKLFFDPLFSTSGMIMRLLKTKMDFEAQSSAKAACLNQPF